MVPATKDFAWWQLFAYVRAHAFPKPFRPNTERKKRKRAIFSRINIIHNYVGKFSERWRCKPEKMRIIHMQLAWQSAIDGILGKHWIPGKRNARDKIRIFNYEGCTRRYSGHCASMEWNRFIDFYSWNQINKERTRQFLFKCHIDWKRRRLIRPIRVRESRIGMDAF